MLSKLKAEESYSTPLTTSSFLRPKAPIKAQKRARPPTSSLGDLTPARYAMAHNETPKTKFLYFRPVQIKGWGHME